MIETIIISHEGHLAILTSTMSTEPPALVMILRLCNRTQTAYWRQSLWRLPYRGLLTYVVLLYDTCVRMHFGRMFLTQRITA